MTLITLTSPDLLHGFTPDEMILITSSGFGRAVGAGKTKAVFYEDYGFHWQNESGWEVYDSPEKDWEYQVPTPKVKETPKGLMAALLSRMEK